MSKSNARSFRKNMTDAERALWRHIRLGQIKGNKFRRQQMLETYIVDFVCLERKLIVEVDGGQHVERMAYDWRRSAWLEAQGFRILRFWNNDVSQNIEAVNTVIADALDHPPPQSSPARGEEDSV